MLALLSITGAFLSGLASIATKVIKRNSKGCTRRYVGGPHGGGQDQCGQAAHQGAACRECKPLVCDAPRCIERGRLQCPYCDRMMCRAHWWYCSVCVTRGCCRWCMNRHTCIDEERLDSPALKQASPRPLVNAVVAKITLKLEATRADLLVLQLGGVLNLKADAWSRLNEGKEVPRNLTHVHREDHQSAMRTSTKLGQRSGRKSPFSTRSATAGA